MRKFLLGRWLHSTAFALALLPVSGGSEAQTNAVLPSRSSSLATKHDAATPVPGWSRFCKRTPEECAVNSSEPATITLTPQAWATLTKVNSQVNAAIRPMTDREHWGVMDRWDLAEDGY